MDRYESVSFPLSNLIYAVIAEVESGAGNFTGLANQELIRRKHLSHVKCQAN